MKRISGVVGAIVLWCGLCGVPAQAALPEVLSQFNFQIVGLGLKAAPEYQAVPKGIATQVLTGFDAGDLDIAAIIAQLPQDYTVRAELSGPAYPIPRTLITRPGRPFDIPTLALLGKHTLSNIRLVDANGTTLFGATPQAVVIESISDPLITEVKTKPLSLEELQERGVTFDDSNFTAYEFTAVIATSSGQVPLNLPVLIPNKEPEYREVVLPTPLSGLATPTEIDLPPLMQNISIDGFMLEAVATAGEIPNGGGGMSLPSIPGILVIPGNIGFLHQYFSALAIVTNGAPGQSNLTITNVQAKLLLPPGDDLTPGSDTVPGDDPLRMAKGDTDFFSRTLPVVNAGPDGQGGTADDRATLNPAETGQADFTIEGLKEGTHKLDFEITATLEGLPVGPVQLKGRATGAVLVRNPDFTVTLGHPETIRTGEAYDLFVTITNTGASVANLVSVRLDPRALSGAVFAGDETPDKQIETILPGSAGTIKYRVVAQRTGKVVASAFASEEVKGRFALRMGIGELGIPLSPDSLILPYTGSLHPDLVTAAVGLLGQAWSVATAPAGALPADVLPISKSTITMRANALSEAGLRRLLGEEEWLAAGDLAYDFFGSDRANRAFDTLRRRSTQGLEFNRALGAIFGAEVAQSGALDFQRALTERSAYRVAQLSVITTAADVQLQLSDTGGQRTGALTSGAAYRELPYADVVPLTGDGAAGTLLLASKFAGGEYRLDLRAATAATFALGIVLPDADGVLQQVRFTGVELAADGRATLLLSPGSASAWLLQIDNNADGMAESTLAPTAIVAILDPPPVVTVATQVAPGFGPGGDKHGRNIAILFNKRVTKTSAEAIAHYAVAENGVDTVKLQASGRMAFVLLQAGIGPFFDRTLTVADLLDDKGQSMLPTTLPIQATAQGPAASVAGTVRLANGTPVAGGVVRLLQVKMSVEGSFPVIVGETRADTEGRYHFDYVLRDDWGPFTLKTALPESADIATATASVAYHGQTIAVDLFMKARGSVSGTVRDVNGAPVAHASVLLTTLTDHQSYLRTTDSTGFFSFIGVSVGSFSLKAVSQILYAEGATMGSMADDGSAVTQDVTIYPGADVTRGNVTGVVTGADGTPLYGALVIIETYRYPNSSQAVKVYADWMYADAAGRYAFTGVYTGSVRVTAQDSVSGEKGTVNGQLLTGESQVYNVILKGTGRIDGQVVREDGQSVSGVYVLAAGRYVVPATDGSFTLDGVPVGGNVTLFLYDGARNQLAQGTVALLSAGETVYAELFVPKLVVARGSIEGTVYRLDGTPAVNAEVRRLVDGTRYFPTHTDVAGHYLFADLPLGQYKLVSLLGREIANATTELRSDGQMKQVDLLPFGFGTVTGTVYDEGSKMLPVGADVRLFAGRLDAVGWLEYDSRIPVATIKSNAQTGQYAVNGVYAGTFTVQASNVFRPNPAAAAGKIVNNNEVVTVDLVLKDTFGSISGQVLLPDGTPAPEGVRVWVLLSGAEVAVTTDSAGKFAFRPVLPAGNYDVTAEDLLTTLTGHIGAKVAAGGDVALTLQLLGRGTLTVQALNADKTVAAGVVVTVKGTAFPADSAQGTTSSTGTVTFGNLSQGRYAITAVGYPDRGGRSEGEIIADLSANSAEVTLAAYGTVIGRFVKADGVTPVVGGQVTLTQNHRILAYALSSSDPAASGSFRIDYVPLGDFTLEGFDPVSARVAKGGGRLNSNGATVTADVVVVPRGTVKGVVLNYAGTTPISGASITIRCAGALNFIYTAATAPDGTFLFSGVPAGVVTVEATDPVNKLKGTASGTLSYEGQVLELETHIAPSGQIEGHVLLPDGVTPSATATVELSGVKRVADPASGYYLYADLAAGRSHTLKARESNSNRFGNVIATIANDGQTAVADIVLRGIGVVTGTVFDADATTPLVGATITLAAAEGVTYSMYSDPAGKFSFSNVPAGAFRLYASHPQRLTAASVSGVLSFEAETVNANLTFGEVASLTGTVLLPDGLTPARGGVVRLSSAKGSFVAVIDTDGRYLFAKIPLCTFTLAFEDASGTAINKSSGALTVNGETSEVGTIILDGKPIAVVATDPADNMVNVAINATIKFKFSEPAQPSTLTAAHIRVLKGTTAVAGSLLPDGDNAGVTFVPTQPLAGFTLYTLVVTTGLRDLVDRPLAQTWSSTFTTIDNLPPFVQGSSPAGGVSEVPVEATVRVTFSETIDAATAAGIRLLLGTTPVATRIDLVQGGTTAILTPLAPLAANAVYAVEVAGVKDAVGNVMSGTYQTTFVTIDTFAPDVSVLSVPAGAELIVGTTVTLTAAVDVDDVALVDFYLDGVRYASDNSAPYNASLLLSRVGTLELKAIAQDKVGNRGIPGFLDLAVKADALPTVLISTPVAGSSVDTGASLTVTVAGSDDLGVQEIVLTGNGATSFTQSRTGLSGKTTTATFTIILPLDADAALPLLLTAVAKDSAGQNGIASERLVTVRDNIPPQGLTLSSDGETTLYQPGASGTVRLAASDNVGLVDASCFAARSGTGLQQWNYAPARKTLGEVFTFNVAGAALGSDTIEISCTVRDAAGLTAQKDLTLGVADVHPPQVMATSPRDGATGIVIRSSVRVDFNEALAPTSVTVATVRLIDPDYLPVAGTVRLGSDARSIVFTPVTALQRGGSYLFVIDGITDLSGNRVIPVSFSFTTDDGAPQIVATNPVAGAQGIQIGSTLTIRFNEAVESATVTPRLTVSSPFGSVSGTVSLAADGQTVYFKPFGLLSYNRAYTVELAAGVEDLSGNPQTGSFSFAFTTEIPNPDLLGLWHFDGDLSDASGNNRNALPSGAPTLVDHGIIAQALALDALDDSIDLGAWFDRQTFSIALWVNPAATQNQNATLLDNNYSGVASWVLQQEESKVNTYQWLVADGSAPLAVMVPPAQWSLLVLTRDAATRSNSLYLNGQLVGTGQGSGEIVYNGSQSLRGGRAVSGERYWSGALDEVAILSVALQPEDVREHFVTATSGDSIPPAAPTAETLPIVTSAPTILLSGNKEAESSIRVNGREIVSLDTSTSWQAFYPLLPGENLLTISSRDASGNSSAAIELYTQLQPALVADPTLFAYWPLDGNWLDYAGNNRHLTAVQGNAFISDRAAGMSAATFTGGGYAVDATAGSLLTAASTFTVTGWIKPQALQSGGVIDLGTESAGTWEIRYDADARLIYQQNWNRTGMESFSTTAGSVPLDRWTHFAVVCAGREATIYLNGVASTTRTLRYDPVSDANAWLELGVHRPGSDEYFTGLLDDVALRTRALSGAEVAALAAASPMVYIAADSNVASYRPGDVGQATFSVIHPAGVEAIICTASGAAAGRVVQNPDGAVRSAGVLDFVVDTAARPNATIRIDCSALATAGDVGSALLLLQVADLVPPVVTTTSVPDQAVDVVGVDPLTVTFDEELDSATVNGETVLLLDSFGNPVAGRVTLSVDGKTIIFTPLAVLPSGGSYRLVIDTGVTDRDRSKSVLRPQRRMIWSSPAWEARQSRTSCQPGAMHGSVSRRVTSPSPVR